MKYFVNKYFIGIDFKKNNKIYMIINYYLTYIQIFDTDFAFNTNSTLRVKGDYCHEN